MYLETVPLVPLSLQLLLQLKHRLCELIVGDHLPVAAVVQVSVGLLQVSDGAHLTLMGGRPICLAAKTVEAHHAIDRTLCVLHDIYE